MRFSQIPAQRPGAVLLVAAGLSLLALAGAFTIEAQVDFVDTVPPSPSVDAYRALVTQLDGVRFLALYQAYDTQSGIGHLRTDAGFDALVRQQRQLTHDLEARFPGAFSHSLSVYEAMRAGHYMFQKLATGGNPSPQSYSVPSDPATYRAVRDQVRANNVADVLARDGASALSLFFFKDPDPYRARQLSGEVADYVSTWRPSEPPVTRTPEPSGLPYSSHYVDERNTHEMRRWAVVSAVAVAATLLVLLRRPSSVLITLTTLGAGLLWTFGLMGLLGIRVSFLTMFLAPLVIGVGVDYPLHLLHRYDEERSRGRPRREAIETATRWTGPAVITAAATTIAGLAALTLVPAPLFAEIGAVSALGIGLSLLAALTLTPALRALVPESPPRARRDRLGEASARAAAALHRRRAAALGVTAALLTIAGLVAATETRIESGSVENEFPADDPVLVLQQRIEHEYGAFQRAYLVVQGDAAQPGVLRALHHAVNASRALPLFHKATAVTDLLIADAKTDQGFVDVLQGQAARPADESFLPQTDRDAREALQRLHDDPLWRTLVPFVITRDYQLTAVAIQLRPTHDQAQLAALRDALESLARAAQEDAGPLVTIDAAGAPINRAAILAQTPWDVAIATLGAAGGVLAALLFFGRRHEGARGRVALAATGIVVATTLLLIATIPILDATYAWLHAQGQGANRAALNDMFLLAFALTVAIGVDGAVHIAARYREERTGRRDPATALQLAYRHAGRAVLAASTTTLVPFLLLTGAYFLQSKNLAILTSAGVLYALLLTYAVLPHVLVARRAPRGGPPA